MAGAERGRSGLEVVEVADRAAFRRWLEAHHDSSRGIWLVIHKKAHASPCLSYEDAVLEAVAFGWIDSTVNRRDETSFFQLFTPRKPKSIWSESNKERVRRLTDQGLMTPAGLAAVDVAKRNGSWTILDEVEALVVPDDLAAGLSADPEAARNFAAFPESQRKQTLWWIKSAKRPQTRAARIETTVRLAAENRWVGDRRG